MFILGGTSHSVDESDSGSGSSYESYNSYSIHNEIFKFDLKTKRWSLAGRMKEDRYDHAVSEIDFTDVAEYCQ